MMYREKISSCSNSKSHRRSALALEKHFLAYTNERVNFGNGKVKVDPKYEAPLLKLATKEKDVQGYVIEVTGYASSKGSTEVNQSSAKIARTM